MVVAPVLAAPTPGSSLQAPSERVKKVVSGQIEESIAILKKTANDKGIDLDAPENYTLRNQLLKLIVLIAKARSAATIAELRKTRDTAKKIYLELYDQLQSWPKTAPAPAPARPSDSPELHGLKAELRRIDDLHYVGETTVEVTVTEPMLANPFEDEADEGEKVEPGGAYNFGLGLFDFAGSIEDQLTAVEVLRNAGTEKAVETLKEVAGEYGFWVKDLDDKVLLAAATALTELKQATPEFIRQFLHDRLVKRTQNGNTEVTWSTFPYDDPATNHAVRKLYEAFQKTGFLITEPAVKDFIAYYESIVFPYYERRPTSQAEIINGVKYNFQIGSVVKDRTGKIIRAVTAETIEIRNRIVPNDSTLYFDPQTGAVTHYVLNGGYTVYLFPDGMSFSTP